MFLTRKTRSIVERKHWIDIQQWRPFRNKEDH